MWHVHKTLSVMAALASAVIVFADAQAADMSLIKKEPYRKVSVSYHEGVSCARSCRGGWWQTVNWGKVYPRYVIRCRTVMTRTCTRVAFKN